MTSLYNRKTDYKIYWLGKGDEFDQSRIERLNENSIDVECFSSQKEFEQAIENSFPHLIIIAGYADIQTNIEIGLTAKANNKSKTLTFMMITEFLDKETKEYFYQSGGNELVLEPASFIEIFFRIRQLKYIFDDKNNSSIQIEEASQMALLAMENSSDLGSTISFVKSATRCNDYAALAESILDAVNIYSDSAIVEIQGAETMHYFGSDGQVDPDLKKLMLANKSKGRIVRFDNAFQINHDRLILLAEGLPIDDHARMGRIADNLAILADTADRFVSGILLQEQAIISELAKTRFISTISHELNTPMNAIQGFSKIFSNRDKDDVVGEKGVIALQSIYNNSVKIKSIIETLIEVTGENEQQRLLSEDDIEVNSLILQLKNRCAILLGQKDIQMIFPERLDLQIKSDQKHVSKMLFHLLDNAIKFTSKGEVELTVSTVADDSIGEAIEFCVRDTGIGISEKNQSKLFKQLGQLNVDHDRNEYGAGIGLYYVQSYAKQLQGKVEVNSSEGKGSTFTLTLPTNTKILVNADNHPNNSESSELF